MVRVVEGRPEEVVEPGVRPRERPLARVLQRVDAREEHAGLGDEVAAGLEPHLDPAPPRRREPVEGGAGHVVAEGVRLERRLAGPVRHAHPAAAVDEPEVRERPDHAQERLDGRPQLGRRPDPAPHVLVDPDDPEPAPRGGLGDRLRPVEADAELRRRPARDHVPVVAGPDARVEPDADLGARVPVAERGHALGVVEVGEHAGLGGRVELGRARARRREQDAGRVHAERPEQGDLAQRDGVEPEPLVGDHAEERGRRVGLERVEEPGRQPGERRPQGPAPLADRGLGVDVGRRPEPLGRLAERVGVGGGRGGRNGVHAVGAGRAGRPPRPAGSACARP